MVFEFDMVKDRVQSGSGVARVFKKDEGSGLAGRQTAGTSARTVVGQVWGGADVNVRWSCEVQTYRGEKEGKPRIRRC